MEKRKNKLGRNPLRVYLYHRVGISGLLIIEIVGGRKMPELAKNKLRKLSKELNRISKEYKKLGADNLDVLTSKFLVDDFFAVYSHINSVKENIEGCLLLQELEDSERSHS